MLFSWLAHRRRAKLLATPFPDEWLGYLERNVPLYLRLNERQKAQLRDDTRILVAEKHWEGCGGLAMTDEVKVTVAAHAALLLLGISHDYFARVMSILIYPSGFRHPEGWRQADGTIDPNAGALGEAWYDGPIVLAWDDVVAGGRNPEDGRNVTLHEFAHQLDYLDGVADGTPPLRKRSDYAQWQEVMTREFNRLKRESEQGYPKVLDSYGATNHAEFFAVATEAFFEKAKLMAVRHQELYAVLSEYYGQDPATWARPDGSPSPEPRVESQRKPHRTSRRAAKVGTHATATINWPGWVTFWEIHPGVSREQARRPFGQHIDYIVMFLVFVLAGIAWNAGHGWKDYLYLILPTLLFLTMVVLAVWLRCAIRWVDRNGAWGGEYRPPEKPEELPAPPG